MELTIALFALAVAIVTALASAYVLLFRIGEDKAAKAEIQSYTVIGGRFASYGHRIPPPLRCVQGDEWGELNRRGEWDVRQWDGTAWQLLRGRRGPA